MVTRMGGRTPYNLAWQAADGKITFTQMGTLMGPKDPAAMVAAVLRDRRLSDWADSACRAIHAGAPVLVALGGKTYPLAGGAL